MYGMVGTVPVPARDPRMGFPRDGLAVALVGAFEPSLAGSELEKLRGGLSATLPQVDLLEQAQVIARVREAVRDGLFLSAHDVSDGGLAVALAECCIATGIGLSADLGSLIEGMAEARGGADPAAIA